MVQLYTANHTTTTGISDLVKLIVLAGESHDVNVEVNNEISSQVVLFIDEFSCRSELKRLLKIKKDRNVNYVLISSEFETDSTCGPSFNEFSKQNKVISFLVIWLSFVLYLTPKVLRRIKILGILTACVGALLFLPALVSGKGWDFLIDKVKFFKRCVYMKARRRGYEEFKAVADLVIKTHERLTDTRNDSVLYPVLPKVAELVNTKIKVSGTETNYRLKMCDEFLNRVNQQDMEFEFAYSGNIKFDGQGQNDLHGFAYQPAQSESWDKSNPIKIWRDYFLHGAVPIVDKKFEDHPIEVIAITTEEFFSREYSEVSVINNFEEYSKAVCPNNEQIFLKISSLDRASR